jgi:hypothetical protein
METKIKTVNGRYMAAGQELARDEKQVFEHWRGLFQKQVEAQGYLGAMQGAGQGLLRSEAEMALAFLVEMDCQADRPAEKLAARITYFTLNLTGLVDQMGGNRVADLALEIRIKALRSMTRTIQALLQRVEGE